ncbi:MAG: SUMF1/EgtB/PvdO family nonheme iron enzyme, partial [bacterium]
MTNRIQSWKDKVDAAKQIERETVADPAFREEIDTVLQKLDALSLAGSNISQTDRKWFVETLQQELNQLGNLSKFKAVLLAPGAIAQGEGAKAVDHGVLIESKGHVVIAEQGAQIHIGDTPVKMDGVDQESTLGRYLEYIIAHNRYLQLQGIRSGGRLVNIELDKIYITLKTTQERSLHDEEKWLSAEVSKAPGEMQKYRPDQPDRTKETVSISVNEALCNHRRLVTLGDPGSGKTTLLRYLTLIYARDQAETGDWVKHKFGLDESNMLPMLLYARQIGSFLQARFPMEDGTEGHSIVINYYLQYLKNQHIKLSTDFFETYLQEGNAVILLDGLDEVAQPDLRRRLSRLLESFVQAYPDCRFIVTSRIVGYKGAARLGENFVTTTIRDFTMTDVENFLTHWHRLVAVGQMGTGPSAETYAEDQTRQLMTAIRSNERIRELAINPLMLTVIALVHRDRVKLPDRRAELYAEAVDVLLGKRDEARGVDEIEILSNKPFDTGDKRLMLQKVALYMHENEQKEIDVDDLKRLLETLFSEIIFDQREIQQTINRCLQVIEERTGLLIARGQGVYAFSHLTFQEYLTALAIADRDDYMEYALNRTADPWWREVILLEAGYLSTQGKERTTRLIKAIADKKQEPESYHNLVLAAECLRDVGKNRVLGDLENKVQVKLREELEKPLPIGPMKSFRVLISRGMTIKTLTERRIAAATALGRIAGTRYWSEPYGEPEWIEIPAGEFTIGSEIGASREKPQHKLFMDRFMISRVPITNTQYRIFVQATGHRSPKYWEEDRITKGKETHPVVGIDWYDALEYCKWLGKMISKSITLPSEAQWEKAARGSNDKREYPWGDKFDP